MKFVNENNNVPFYPFPKSSLSKRLECQRKESFSLFFLYLFFLLKFFRKQVLVFFFKCWEINRNRFFVVYRKRNSNTFSIIKIDERLYTEKSSSNLFITIFSMIISFKFEGTDRLTFRWTLFKKMKYPRFTWTSTK